MKTNYLPKFLFGTYVILVLYFLAIFGANLLYLIVITVNPDKADLNSFSLKYYNSNIKDSVSLRNSTKKINLDSYYYNKITHANYKLSQKNTVYYCSKYPNEIIPNKSKENLVQTFLINFFGFLCFGFLLIEYLKNPKKIIDKYFSTIYYTSPD